MVRHLLSVFFLVCLSFSAFAAEITLSSGWNLITIPIAESSTPIAAYLESNLSSGSVKRSGTTMVVGSPIHLVLIVR